jgi:transposase-like protein
MVIEGTLKGELDDHLGYGKHKPEGRGGGNTRNGRQAKTVLTDTGRWRFRCRRSGIPVSSRKSSLKGSGG